MVKKLNKFNVTCCNCGSKKIDIYCTLNEDVYLECLNCRKKEKFVRQYLSENDLM